MRSQLTNKRGPFFAPHPDLNHGRLELTASVLPMSYTIVFVWIELVIQTQMF